MQKETRVVQFGKGGPFDKDMISEMCCLEFSEADKEFIVFRGIALVLITFILSAFIRIRGEIIFPRRGGVFIFFRSDRGVITVILQLNSILNTKMAYRF